MSWARDFLDNQQRFTSVFGQSSIMFQLTRHTAGSCVTEDTEHLRTKLANLYDFCQGQLLCNIAHLIFACTKLQYRKWSTHELQRWLSTARKIIQRYKLNLNKKDRKSVV